MNKIAVSIIVPVYNVEKYVVRCIESIASQTFTDVEAIFIDDCGKDRSMELIERFIADYHGKIEFRIIHMQKNGGQSAARNKGIREARGKYLYFMDCDDYISNDCIEILYSVISKDYSLQMVVGNYKIIGPLHFEPMSLEQRSYVKDEIIEAQLSYQIYTMPWNKLVLRKFITDNNMFFQEGIIHEDNLWSFCTSFLYEKIAIVLKPTYYYVIHSSSTERRNTEEFHDGQLFRVLKYLIGFVFSENSPVRPSIRTNTTVYHFIQNEIKSLLMKPYITGKPALALERYKELRALDFYKLNELKHISSLGKDGWLQTLHFSLPTCIGFRFFCWLNRNKYQITNDMHKIKLTIITINYNNLEGLKRTIPSVIAQTYTGYEFIVIDGGSTDGSKEYIQSQERIDYWVSEPDKGVYNAMNKGVKMAHGEYTIFMNSGDMFFSPLALEQSVCQLNEADFYTGRTICIDGSNVYPWLPPIEITLSFMLTNALSHQATFSKTSILKANLFNENNKIVSDWELFFEEWYLNNRKYEAISPIVAIYYMDGISCTNKELDKLERRKVVDRLVGPIVQGEKSKGSTTKEDNKKCREKDKECREKDKIYRRRKELEIKLHNAMNKKPVARDLKIIRNGIKFLIKDLFN